MPTEAPAREHKEGRGQPAVVSRLRERFRRKPPKTVFVLSGGGNLGALQVGMLRALLERRIRPELVLGCSVGAMNGCALAAEPTLGMVGRLQEMWLDLEDKDVLPQGLLPTTVQLARKGSAVHNANGLRAVTELMLDGRWANFEDLAVPFGCVATDLVKAEEHWFDRGPLVPAILASAAIPAVFPPVEIDGVRYFDGAVVNDVPLSRAVELGATTIYALHVGSFDRPRPEPKRPIDMAMQAYWIARRNRFKRDLASLPPGVKVHVLPAGEAPVLRFNDLRHSDRLIAMAYKASVDYLDGMSAEEGS
jgi:NTE family protein